MQIADLPRQPSLLIRISREWRPGLTDAQLYERVRRYWRINPLQRSIQPKLAYGLAEGVIRAVYGIDAWETYDMALARKSDDRLDQTPHASGRRIGFVGSPEPGLQHLVGLALLDAPKSQNPVTYLHC